MPVRAPLAGRLTPRGPRGTLLPVDPSPLQVWAVEDTTVQVTWGSLPAGEVVVETDDGAGTALEHGGGPGGLVVAGLPPGTPLDLRVRWEGGAQVLSARTLPAPPGQLLARVATLSDLHLGATRWGFLRTMAEERAPGEAPHPLRCAAAALAEATAWGADLVVLKGDLVEHQDPDHFDQARQLLAGAAPVAVLALPGNHDVDGETPVGLPADLGPGGVGYVDGVTSLDLPGVRVVGADTTVPGRGWGRLGATADAVVERAAEAPGAALVLLHHQLQRHRLPTYWPAGIEGGEARRFLDRLARAQPASVVSSGHTHRNRARRHGPVLVTEVGSTKDWPGVWAGYAIHEGGIRQVVRRTQEPGAIAWTEYSRLAVLGLWGRWAPGRLDQRCLVHTWPRRSRSLS